MNKTTVETDNKVPGTKNAPGACESCSVGEEKEGRRAFCLTARELVEAGKDALADEMIINRHLIYSSPATLAFNSPGAQGFGVKRAGLAIPGSVMLLVAPGCCGRNTTILSELGGYSDRFYYLMMDETDIVTGRHLKKIPQAVQEIYDGREEKPTVVMICITCVDALLGTDMERVCKKAQETVGIPVLPCYMYALTREGRKPPMVHVRQSIYSLLEPWKKKSTLVNLLGHFAPLMNDCELYELLRQAGVKTIREISRCESYEEYLSMAEANFNLVLVDDAVIEIGDNVMIGPNVVLCTGTHPVSPRLRAKEAQYNKRVKVGSGVWIGANTMVMPGVTIGENSIIGAGSVVTKDIPANVVAFGNPCKVYREITEEDEKYYDKDKLIDIE